MIQQPKLGTSPGTVRPAGKLSNHYQALLRRIRNAGNGSAGRYQTVGVTSCTPRAGVSSVAANLAVAAARAGAGPVLLIDANLRRPSVQRTFRTRRSPGLAEALCGKVDPLDCIQPSAVENLSIVTAGTTNGQAEPSYDPARVAELLDVFKHRFDMLVFDLPEATELSACLAIAGVLDGVVLVIEAEQSDSRAALRTKQQLAEVKANLLGVVFNKRRKHLPGWLYRML